MTCLDVANMADYIPTQNAPTGNVLRTVMFPLFKTRGPIDRILDKEKPSPVHLELAELLEGYQVV